MNARRQHVRRVRVPQAPHVWPAGIRAVTRRNRLARRRTIGQNERGKGLESVASILPQPSRCVIQCLGSLQYRLGQEHPQV